MIDKEYKEYKEYVEQYVKDEINKHETSASVYGWKAVVIFIINEVFLIWLIFNY